MMIPFFGILKLIGLFRVPPEMEAAGLDISHHGTSLTSPFHLLLSCCQHACLWACAHSWQVPAHAGVLLLD